MIRRIATVETAIGRMDDLENDVTILKENMKKALAPREPDITRKDVERWDKNCQKTLELEELISKLLKETE